jgi:retinol dehydrogenase-12
MGVYVCLDPLFFPAELMFNTYRIQVNHLSTSLLTLLLLPTIARTAEKYNTNPHVTVVSSDMHLMIKKFPSTITEKPSILEALSDPAYCNSSSVSYRHQGEP